MKRVLTAVVLIPLVLLVLFKAPLWLFTLVVGAVALGAAWEYLGLVKAVRLQPLTMPVLMTCIAVFTVAALYDSVSWATFGLAFFLSVFALLAFLALSMRQPELDSAFASATANATVIPYVLWPFLALCVIRFQQRGVFLIVFLLAIVWSGDIFAYYAGRTFGKHKLAPRISPGKTWEGTIASFIGSVFLAHILFVDNRQIMDALYRWHLSSTPAGLSEVDKHVRLVHGVILGGFVNVAAQVGDLVESMMKRSAGIKDSGTILPGHGGILDRIDALLFAIPVLYFYTMMYPAWTFYTPFYP